MGGTEATPLKAGESSKEGGKAQWWEAYSVAFAIGFYIVVAVVKICLTKAMLNGASTPVALSAMSCIVTSLSLIPVFLVKPKTWGVIDWRKNGMGFAGVTLLVTLDLMFTNIAMSLLAVPIQQTIVAANPVVTVLLETVVTRKLNHPVIYMTLAVLVVGPIIAPMGMHGTSSKNLMMGIVFQICGLLCSASKAVFMREVMKKCKEGVSSFAFLFWLDLATLIILLPLSFSPWKPWNPKGVAGKCEMVALFESLHTALDGGNLFFTSLLGGLRFYSQIIVLRVTTATNLSVANFGWQAIAIYLTLALFGEPKVTPYLICGTGLTMVTVAVYTYWKTSKILTKHPMCIKFNADFVESTSCLKKRPPPEPESAGYSKA